ncbi:ribonuclease H, partial [Trifolium pratense]
GDVVERILATPLVGSVREDKVVWEEERNECYSVKSGYKLSMRYIIRSDKYHVAGNLNGIWKAQAPHKERHLLWRLCKGCLPTRCRLLQRRVECTLNYPVCDEEFEDELDVFFNCTVARASWCATDLSSVLHNNTYQQTATMDRIFALCSNENSDTVGRVAMLLWSIWHNRNDKVWNDNVQMPSQIGRHAFDAWNDWYSVHKQQSNSVSMASKPDLLRWEKPIPGWFMAGMTQWLQYVTSTLEGEAWALLLAMKEASHRGFGRVQFECGLKVLVDAIHMMHRDNSKFLSIVQDIVIFMSSFLNFEVKFVRRQENSVAHTLARAANSWASFHRFEIIHLCIEHLLVNEMH